MTQLELGAAPRICEWCKVARAVARVIGTFACAACASSRKARISAWFESLGYRG